MITWLRRRVLPLILVVAMLASYLPLSAFADEGNVWKVQAGTSLSLTDVTTRFPECNGHLWKIVDSEGKDAYVPYSLSNIDTDKLRELARLLLQGNLD